ncbi:hypothetical protein GCM10011273_26940 [Asticcacaulis endophyticus]|uniref:Uncharacterized protein n=1 Tax=Asticcacaulis endophyticus TaxID=1395890 RepID=A0A918QBI4_9CAUL|nr:hypothetical protein GCM10011273_26940 [Asticcacaulis endophyticus]
MVASVNTQIHLSAPNNRGVSGFVEKPEMAARDARFLSIPEKQSDRFGSTEPENRRGI